MCRSSLSMGSRKMRRVGLVDENTIAKAAAVGINIAGGSINKKDRRVRVFVKGKFPRTSHGYALRSRVVWWLNTGELVPANVVDIHHRNTNRSDDRFENLEKRCHIQHGKDHHPKTCQVERTCLECGVAFTIDRWRLKDPSRGRFCGQDCYQAHPKSRDARERQSLSMKRKYAEGWRPR